jgi:hypothetical protein
MKVTLKSGAVLDITRAPFVISHKLFKTVLKELKNVSLKLGLKEGKTLGDLVNLELTDEALNTAKDGVFTLLSSQEIEDVLWECFGGRVLYGSKKVDLAFFNDEKVQEEYHEIMKEVLQANLSPFRKSLESLFPKFRLEPKSSKSPELK